MKQQKPVINRKDLPARFGWPFWIMLYLTLKHFDPNQIVWFIAYILFGIWTLLFGYVKSKEKPFSVVSFRNNINKWLKDD